MSNSAYLIDSRQRGAKHEKDRIGGEEGEEDAEGGGLVPEAGHGGPQADGAVQEDQPGGEE